MRKIQILLVLIIVSLPTIYAEDNSKKVDNSNIFQLILNKLTNILDQLIIITQKNTTVSIEPHVNLSLNSPISLNPNISLSKQDCKWVKYNLDITNPNNYVIASGGIYGFLIPNTDVQYQEVEITNAWIVTEVTGNLDINGVINACQISSGGEFKSACPEYFKEGVNTIHSSGGMKRLIIETMIKPAVC